LSAADKTRPVGSNGLIRQSERIPFSVLARSGKPAEAGLQGLQFKFLAG